MQSRASRAGRGWIAGSFATGIAATSHALADGAVPSALALTVALVFAGILGTFVIGRAPSLPRLAVIVAGSQLAFHLAFSALTPGGAVPAGHHGVARALEPVLAPAIAHHGADPTMWIAHAAAMLATLWFLRRAEMAVWRMLREALHVVRFRLPVVATRPHTTLAVSADAPRHPLFVPFLSIVSHRGPPATGFAS
ncbi:MAG TPA: hypothetical protein VNS80_00725 [Pseudolysinimonas sp.]|nr:hypothetical protein [Pseudolysinimonas sp.]